VQDFGSGIPKRDWKNIFRPGFSTKKYGWGLGLSLTNRIIKDFHKGKLFVKESSSDEGTIISIII
jgi:C4-dicarboxylate-specific signal transduction histidine kinase